MSRHNSDNKSRSALPKCSGGFVGADLKAYLDGELSGARKWYVTFHLNRCSACREELTWLQRLGKNMRTLEEAHPGPELRARILSTLPPMDSPAARPAAFRAQAGAQRPVYQSRAFRYSLATACVALLAIMLVESERKQGGGHNTVASIGTPGGHSTPIGEVRPAPHPESAPDKVIASSNQPTEERDPTSAAADRAVAEMERQEKLRVARQIPQLFNRAIRDAQTVSADSGPHQSAIVQLVLDVSGSQSAETRLKEWARHTSTACEVVDAQPGSSGATQIVLQLAPSQGSSLLAELKKTGTVSSVAATSSSRPGETVIAHKVIPPVPTDDHNASTAVTKHGDLAGAATEHSVRIVGKQDPAKVSVKNTVCVVILLVHS